MPGRDGTGPNGTGSGTGRRMGGCGNYTHSGYAGYNQRGMNRGFFCRGLIGRSIDFARGFLKYGYPRPNSWQNSSTAYDEKAALENEIKALTEQIEIVRNRLSRIETKNN